MNSRGLDMFGRPRVALTLGLGALIYFLVFVASMQVRWRSLDFSAYYVWSRLLRSGINPYITNGEPFARAWGMSILDRTNPAALLANYPPTFLLLFEPLTWLSPQSAHWIWTILNVIFLALVLVMLDSDPAVTNWTRLSFISLALLYLPISLHFYWDQAQLLILLLLLAGLRSIQIGRDFAGGALIALACLLKLYPIVMLGYLFFWRRWRVMAYVAITLAFGALITVMLVGRDISVTFVPRLSSVNDLMGELSVSGAVYHVLKFSGVPPGPFASIARQLLTAFADLAVVGLAIRATLLVSADRVHEDRTFALWLVAMLLITPSSWSHYAVMLIPLFAEIGLAANEGAASRLAIGLAIASYLLADIVLLGLAGHELLERLLDVRFPVTRITGLFFAAGVLAFASGYCLANQTESKSKGCFMAVPP